MGGIKNPFGGGNIGLDNTIVGSIFGKKDKPQEEAGPVPMGQFQTIAAINEQQLREQIDNQNKLAPQSGEFAAQLANQALGKAPSTTELQLKSAMDRSLAQQVAAAKANRAVNPALASRQVSNAAAQQQAQTAQAAGIQRLQEQQVQQNQFANYLAQQQQQKNALISSGLQGGQMFENADARKRAQGAAENAADKQFAGSLIGGAASVLAGPAGSLGATLLSDKNTKQNIKESKDSSKSFLDALKSYNYKYKDEKNGKGEQFSVMAQDLEKAGPVGKAMVEESPEGKKVNYGKGFAAILAAQVELNQRLAEIEKKYGKKG